MNNKVDELVEWVAEKICTIDGNEWGFINDATKTLFDGAPSKSIYRGRAKQILSHPDLALMDRTVDVGIYPFRDAVISLAEALKEVHNG